MNIITTYEYTDEDKAILLNRFIPDDPCIKCGSMQSACCGCPQERDYFKEVKVFKDNNLVEVARKFKEVHQIKRKIRNLELERDLLIDELPDFLKEFTDE